MSGVPTLPPSPTADLSVLSDECSNGFANFGGAHRLPYRFSNKRCANDREPHGDPNNPTYYFSSDVQSNLHRTNG